MLTVLDVINQCLASMALAPITEAEVPGHAYAESAQAKLNTATTDTLARGWWINERLVTGEAPEGTLRVEGAHGRTLSWHGAAAGIYDHTLGEYTTTPPAKTLAYVAIPFPDLPPPLQAYIAALTVAAFQAEFDGSDTKQKQLGAELARSLAVVQEIDRNSRVRWNRLWELLSYGWWFNTMEFTGMPGANVLPGGTLNVQGPANQPLFLNQKTNAICSTWGSQPITAPVERCRAVIQIEAEALPPHAAEWLRKASAIDIERESLSPDPRVLADLQHRLDESFACLRRENGERMILREQSREFQARGWWFNTFPLSECISEDDTGGGGGQDNFRYAVVELWQEWASNGVYPFYLDENGTLVEVLGGFPIVPVTATVPTHSLDGVLGYLSSIAGYPVNSILHGQALFDGELNGAYQSFRVLSAGSGGVDWEADVPSPGAQGRAVYVVAFDATVTEASLAGCVNPLNDGSGPGTEGVRVTVGDPEADPATYAALLMYATGSDPEAPSKTFTTTEGTNATVPSCASLGWD